MSTSRIPRLLSAFSLAVTVLCTQAITDSLGASAATASVTASGTNTVGSKMDVSSSFVSPGAAGNFVVDTELYNSSKAKVRQWSEDVRLTSTRTVRHYALDTTGLPVGTYTFQQGIFNANWAGVRSWNSTAGSVTIAAVKAAATSSNSWRMTASASGSGNVQINSTFVAPANFASAQINLDTEVVNSSGTKIAQWTEPVGAGAGQSFARSYKWNSAGVPAGTYSIQQGVFTQNWASLGWRSAGVTASVAAVAASVGTAAQTSSTQRPAATSTTTAPKASVSTGNPFAGAGFYANPDSSAAAQAAAWSSSRPADAAYMDRIAKGGAATWLGNWTANVQGTVAGVTSAASSQGQVPVFVAYNIPGRDCGSYSAGGASGTDAYRSWIRSVAAGIGGGRAAVILEPDALAQIDCLSANNQADRLSLLSDAVNVLSSHSGTSVYLDAGHPGWLDVNTMASRLTSAGVSQARGFSLNVSNFVATADNVSYGEAISKALGGSHYVVDTSRNGNGSNGDWCNPAGRALGATPTTNTGAAHADAFLWVKQPGESDGSCNGGPGAGSFWADYALGLAKSAWG